MYGAGRGGGDEVWGAHQITGATPARSTMKRFIPASSSSSSFLSAAAAAAAAASSSSSSSSRHHRTKSTSTSTEKYHTSTRTVQYIRISAARGPRAYCTSGTYEYEYPVLGTQQSAREAVRIWYRTVLVWCEQHAFREFPCHFRCQSWRSSRACWMIHP